MIEIVPFHVEHYLKLLEGPVTEFTLSKDKDKARTYAELFASRGPAFSGKVGDEIIGCAGVMIMWPGVGEAWLVLAERVKRDFKREAYACVISYLVSIIENKGLHRVQAHCRVDIPKAAQYLENIGFKREAVMEKYDEDGTDHYLYAMVK